jgi:signal transduction histidine kinase
MMRTFAGKLSSLAALLGFVLVALLAGAGYTLVSTIRAGNEALSTYADELILAWSLQEAYERKLASGRGFLIARDRALMREFETAAVDTETVLGKLRQRVNSNDGLALLDEATRTLRAHEEAFRDVMTMGGTLPESSAAWATHVMPKASRARNAMDAFIRYKHALYDAERAHLSRAQQQATWVVGSTALAALLVALLGGGRLLRSAKRTYAAEKQARTAAEQERRFFHTLLDQLPIGIVAADPSGKIMHLSRFARRMLEQDQLPWGTQLVGDDDYAAWPAFRADGSRYSGDDLPLARGLRGEVVAQEEIRSAAERVYSVTAGPIRDESGKTIAAVVALVDISERKRGEKERELFVGALGHDLRNPVQAILLAANSLARRNDIPDVAKKPVARIASSADRLNGLISELLDFATSQHGAIPIKPEKCELHEIAADVIAEIKLARPDRDIRVEPQGACDGHCDRGRMAQVFQNLLVNAVEHGDPKAPITVRTGCRNDEVWAAVTNRGAIPPEERRRIFEPFRRHATSKGLGLGLYIARALVEAHGGTIGVECQNDQTVFLIKLPLQAGTKMQPHDDRRSA